MHTLSYMSVFICNQKQTISSTYLVCLHICVFSFGYICAHHWRHCLRHRLLSFTGKFRWETRETWETPASLFVANSY